MDAFAKGVREGQSRELEEKECEPKNFMWVRGGGGEHCVQVGCDVLSGFDPRTLLAPCPESDWREPIQDSRVVV